MFLDGRLQKIVKLTRFAFCFAASINIEREIK